MVKDFYFSQTVSKNQKHFGKTCVKQKGSKFTVWFQHQSSSHVSNMIRTNLDSLPAEDADHGRQGQDEEGGETDRQDQDDTLVSLRSLKIREHGVRFSCQRSA